MKRSRNYSNAYIVSALDVYSYHCTTHCNVLVFFVCTTTRSRAFTFVNNSLSLKLFSCGMGLLKCRVCVLICPDAYSSSFFLRTGCLNTPRWCTLMFALASAFEYVDLLQLSYHSVFVTSPSRARCFLLIIYSLP